MLPGAFPFRTSHRLVGSVGADPSPFTASTVANPKMLNNHKGQARGRGLRATSTPPGCGVTFWNAFHFEQWSSFFIVYNFHRSIHPTVTLIHSTNGFLFLPCPLSELFEICFRDVSFHQTLRRNGTDIILNGDAGQWGTFYNFSRSIIQLSFP